MNVTVLIEAVLQEVTIIFNSVIRFQPGENQRLQYFNKRKCV